MGDEITLIETSEKSFAAFSIATTDSYKDENGQWHQKQPIWHKVLAFSPQTIAFLKNLKMGTRLEIVGSLSYRPFETLTQDGVVVKKQEATIIVHNVEQKPLVKKTKAV